MTTHPEWALIGTRRPDGKHVVIATRDLDRATITSTQRLHRAGPGRYAATSDRETTAIRLETSAIVSGVGDTYDDALTALFRRWSPTGGHPDPDAAPAPPTELGQGSPQP